MQNDCVDGCGLLLVLTELCREFNEVVFMKELNQFSICGEA